MPHTLMLRRRHWRKRGTDDNKQPWSDQIGVHSWLGKDLSSLHLEKQSLKQY